MLAEVSTGRCGGESTSMSKDPAAMDATASFSSHAASAVSAASTSRPQARPSHGMFVRCSRRRPPSAAATVPRHRPPQQPAAATRCSRSPPLLDSAAAGRHRRRIPQQPPAAASPCFSPFDLFWSRSFSWVGTANQRTSPSVASVQAGPAPNRCGDQDYGFIWVGYGLVHGFLEPTNRASSKECRGLQTHQLVS